MLPDHLGQQRIATQRAASEARKPSAATRSAAITASLADVATGITTTGAHGAPAPTAHLAARAAQHAGLPVKHIERVLRADGQMSHGVLEVDLNRSDVEATGGQSHASFVAGFQLQHEIYSQSLRPGRAIVNGDLALKPSEIQPVIDAMLAKGLKV